MTASPALSISGGRCCSLSQLASGVGRATWEEKRPSALSLAPSGQFKDPRPPNVLIFRAAGRSRREPSHSQPVAERVEDCAQPQWIRCRIQQKKQLEEGACCFHATHVLPLSVRLSLFLVENLLLHFKAVCAPDAPFELTFKKEQKTGTAALITPMLVSIFRFIFLQPLICFSKPPKQ